MLFRILADGVVGLHFLWIIFLIFGGFGGRRYETVKYFHLSGLVFAIILQAFDWLCPLTHLEVWLRAKHDPALVYEGSYIVHYIEKIIYVEVEGWVITALTIALCLFNFWLYSRGK